MAEAAPEFDPSKPFETVGAAPEFDPDKPFEPVEPALPGHVLAGAQTLSNSPAETSIAKRSVFDIAKAFGQDFGEAWGPEPLGLSNDSIAWAKKTGLFRGDDNKPNPFQAFNETIFLAGATALDAAARLPGAVYKGLQSAGVEAGLARDVVSIPDAFMGTHGFGIPKLAEEIAPGGIRTSGEVAPGGTPLPEILVEPETPKITGGVADKPDLRVAKDLGVIGEPRPPITEGTPAEAVSNAVQPITAYHGSPYSFDAFDVGKIGEGEGNQSFGHGLYFAENPGVAEGYRTSVTKNKALMGGASKGETEIRQEHGMWSVYVNGELENQFGAKSDAEKYASRGVTYQVRIHADRDMLLDFDKPLREQPQRVQDAVKAAYDAAYPEGDKALRAKNWEEFKSAEGGTLVRKGAIAFDDDRTAKLLSEAGIPGIKYLDQGSRGKPDALGRQLQEVRDAIALVEKQTDSPTQADRLANLRRDEASLAKDFEYASNPTRNFVIFDHNDVEITHKNGEAVRPPAPPSPPPEPPRPPGGESGGGSQPDNGWRARFDHFVGRIETPDDIKELIKKAADEQDDFPAARRGDVPLAHVEAIAQAAGVAPDSIDARGLGRLFKTDNEVRLAMQAMLTATDNVKAAAREHVANPSDTSRIALQESMLRRDMAVEQIVGYRAEWGRVGNALQEFMRDIRDQETLSQFMEDRGRGARTPSDLDALAASIDAMDRGALPGYLNDARKKTWADWAFWYWQNQLISGWLTHTKYVEANASYLGWERGIITPIAAVIGKAKEMMGVDASRQIVVGGDRVYLGEAVAGMMGSISATPMALLAALKSVKTGLRVPLEGEVALRDAAIARGEKVPLALERTVNPVTQSERPIGGVAGRIIGVPGDAANAIHTFFRLIGSEGEAQAQAYRQAREEGMSPVLPQFWDRQAAIRANLSEKQFQAVVDTANKGTFIQESGPIAKAFQKFVKAVPGLRWLFPFTHIPLNLMKASVEMSPLAPLAMLREGSELGDTLRGKNGGVEQDRAIARIVAGSAVMGWVVNMAVNGKATGDYPTEPAERDKWKLRGTQPNSILIGDQWVSFSKFGPLGDVAGMGANIGQNIPHLTSDDDDAMTHATWALAQAMGNLATDEVGMQSLKNLFEALKEEKKGTAIVSNYVGSAIPASSFLGQTASFNDPEMRKAATFIDGLKYRIPGTSAISRQSLLPQRDWLGEPLPNPGYATILRQRQVINDPVFHEADALDIHPAPPQSRIGGVTLPPKMYDKYQEVAGGLTRMALEKLVNSPGWYDYPRPVREDMFRNMIRTSRSIAAASFQAAYPQVIQQGVEDKTNHILGAKKTKLPEAVQ